MAQVLVRDVPDDVLKRLKALAKSHKRSLQSELRAALIELAQRHERQNFVRWLRRLRKRQKPDRGPSTLELLRADRRREG
jgi:plasmid stability protein